MKNRLAAAVATIAVAVTTLTATATPAQADGRMCATHAAYRAVRIGMTKPQVAWTLSTRGHQVSYANSGGYRFEIRQYPGCWSSWAVVTVGFAAKPWTRLRVQNKNQI